MVRFIFYVFLLLIMPVFSIAQKQLSVKVYETSASGNKLSLVTVFSAQSNASVIKIFPDQTFQTITGFGGSFTESSAYLLNKLSNN